MKRIVFGSLFLILLSGCKNQVSREILPQDLFDQLSFLASDSLKGRYPGTDEDSVLLHYIADEYKHYGLDPLYEDYIQYFPIYEDIRIDTSTNMRFGNKTYVLFTDFLPLSFSSSSLAKSSLVFAGYGIDKKGSNREWNDYEKIDVRNKWVALFKGTPAARTDLENYITERDKVLSAIDNGAVGVVFIADDRFEPEKKAGESAEPPVIIPVLEISKNIFTEMLKEKNIDLTILRKKLQEKPLGVFYETIDTLQAEVKQERLEVKTGNVIAMIQGQDPEVRNEWIVIGAHHDHLGYGGEGTTSREPDTLIIHNGADDNASGISALLELASYLGSPEIKLARSVAFVSFGAEEKGLIGSKYFTNHLPENMTEILAMVNMDMIGHLNDNSSLEIGGIGTSLEAEALIDSVNKHHHLNLKLISAGFGPSDHASFYTKDIPVFYFNTGIHSLYHTSKDDIDSINFEGMANITKFISDLILELSNIDSLTYQQAGPKERKHSYRKNMVTLGIMPDVSGEKNTGLLILGVSEGKPADICGLQKGDIIIGIDNFKIQNIQDYMFRMKEFKTGDQAIITVLRENKEKKFKAQF